MPTFRIRITFGDAHLGKTGKINHTQRSDIGNGVALACNVFGFTQALFKLFIEAFDAGFAARCQFRNRLHIGLARQTSILESIE